ncbi:MAG: hypothetical protein D6736_15030 [Nitrospinota bacterium]|nr:MAG: hypothetical protein D6736_15030 [Nitrospinota bacterium]
MARIISVHEYLLRPESNEAEFRQALLAAQRRGLLRLPGLVEHHFLQGIKGAGRGQYAALWIYESREAWERLWGSPDQPRQREEYPENWKIWEEEVLAPFLQQDPDQIRFTAYEEWGG